MGSGILEVKLLDARGLSNTDFLSKIDPYVILQYRNEERKSNVANEGGSNPVWNQSFKFRVQYPSNVDNQYKIILKLMDKDTFSRDDYLGQATYGTKFVIYMAEVIAEGMEKGFAALEPYTSRVIRSDGTYSGEVRVAATFTKQVRSLLLSSP